MGERTAYKNRPVNTDAWNPRLDQNHNGRRSDALRRRHGRTWFESILYPCLFEKVLAIDTLMT